MTECVDCGETDPDRFTPRQHRCKPCRRVYDSAYYHRCREANPLGSWIRYACQNARQRAGRRKLPCTINSKWVRQRWTGVCEATGVDLELSHLGPRTPSLDRIDSSLGYTPENTRIICYGFNLLRSNRDDDAEVLEFMAEVAAAPRDQVAK